MTKFLIFIFILGLSSCGIDEKETQSIIDLVESKKEITVDTNEVITRENLLASFDTIPNEYGIQLVEEVLIKLESKSDLKQAFTTGYLRQIDTVKTTLFQKKNSRLDPQNKLSEDSYFFIIIFGNINDYSLASPFFIDLKNDNVGMFSFPSEGKKIDSLHNIENLDSLRERLK